MYVSKKSFSFAPRSLDVRALLSTMCMQRKETTLVWAHGKA
jgi:hypothetical protein